MTEQNRQFEEKCQAKLALEERRLQQHIIPLIKKYSYRLFPKHSKEQTILKVDGCLLIDGQLTFIENKCIRKDWPCLFVEMWIDRNGYREKGWGTRDTHYWLSDKRVLLINAYESFVKVYDMQAIKTFVKGMSGRDYREMIGRDPWIGSDDELGGVITGYNFPHNVLEKFEVVI